MTSEINKLRIAYLISNCDISGGLAAICQHCNRLTDRGHFVIILCTSKSKNISWFPGNRVEVVNIDEWQDDLDMVIATEWSTSYSLLKVRAAHRAYFVQSDETRFYPDGSIGRLLSSLSYNLRVNYFTEAKWLQDWLKINFGHSPFLIKNGLDNKIFYPDTPLAPKGPKPRILLEGAINVEYKGMREAFQAVKKLDAEVWCVSSFGYPEKDWKCDRFFHGVPMHMMRKIYSSCDILLKLSRIEGFFGPPMEMMACGGAVIVGRVSGYDEYIIDGYNALVVDPLNIREAEIALIRLINEKDFRETLIRGGFETVRSWGWNDSIDALEKRLISINAEGKDMEALRTIHNANIVGIYNILQGSQLEDKIKTFRGQAPPPEHAVKLAGMLSRTRLFITISAVIKRLYIMLNYLKYGQEA